MDFESEENIKPDDAVMEYEGERRLGREQGGLMPTVSPARACDSLPAPPHPPPPLPPH